MLEKDKLEKMKQSIWCRKCLPLSWLNETLSDPVIPRLIDFISVFG
jgi:hypothetical protein